MRFFKIFCAAFLLSLAFTVPAQAATLNVDGANPSCSDTTGTPYCTLQAAIDAANDMDTIVVAPGVYEEDIFIDKQVTIQGPFAGVPGYDPSRDGTGEAVIIPATSRASADLLGLRHVVVSVDNVTIDGITIDADNPNPASPNPYELPDGTLTDADYNIATWDEDFNVYNVNDLLVTNNRLLNAAVTSFYGWNPGYSTLSNNYIFNASGPFGRGIITVFSHYATVENNVMENVTTGVQTNNFSQPNPDPTFDPATDQVSISGNTIEANFIGIFINLHFANSAGFIIANNDITPGPFPETTLPTRGIDVSSIQANVDVDVADNDVTGFDWGIGSWNNPTSNPVEVTGGTLTGNDIGFYAYDCSEEYGQAGGVTPTITIVDGVTIVDAQTASVLVSDNFFPAPVVNPINSTCSEAGPSGEGSPSNAPVVQASNLTIVGEAPNHVIVETETDDPQGSDTIPSLTLNSSTVTAGDSTVRNVWLRNTLSAVFNADGSRFFGAQTGIAMDTGQVTLTNIYLNGASDTGLAITGGDPAASALSDSCIVDNANTGVGNTTGIALPAPDNWWGAPKGPAPAGFGDPITTDVNATNPLSAAPPECMGRNQARNVGFETVLDPVTDWDVQTTGNDQRLCGDPRTFEGNCVMLFDGDAGLTELASQEVLTGLRGSAGDTFVFSYYLAGANIAPDTLRLGGRVLFRQGTLAEPIYCLTSDRGTFNWRQVTCTVTAPIDFETVTIQVGIQDASSGLVAFDSVRLEWISALTP
ncbi:MAG: nitrous oxide reductase family maturation protein NosD [Anaerolineae bacterium]